MVRAARLVALALLPACSVAQFAALSNAGEFAVKTVLQKVMRLNDTQVQRVLAKPNVTLPPHDFAADLTDENWETVLRTGSNNPLEASLPSDAVWIITVHAQDQFSKMFINATDGVAQHNSSAAGGTLPSNMRFARLNYHTETVLTTRWWIWRAPVIVIATDNLKTLRFIKLGALPPFRDPIAQFLLDESWWRKVPTWQSSLAPGGRWENLLARIANAWAVYHRTLSSVPSLLLVVFSGMLLNLGVGYFHKDSSSTSTTTSAQSAAAPAASQTAATLSVATPTASAPAATSAGSASASTSATKKSTASRRK